MTMFPGLQEIRSRLVSGDLSLPEYIAELKARHEAWNHLNAVVALDPDYIEAQVRSLERHRGSSTPGPLYGIPFTAKDNINTAALPTTACTPALLGNRPPRDAGVIRRLLDAGAILFSKTNMHELAFGITTSHGAYGAARNPYDPSLIPGGSSGGTAAAVAAGLVPFGIGSDTGGSVRIPAALCGVCGFRPTTGRYPKDGIVPISRTRDTPGPIARSVEDLLLLDGILSGGTEEAPLPDLKGVRLGVPRGCFYENLESTMEPVIESALARIADAGVTLVEADIANIRELNDAVSFTIVLYEARRDLEAYLRESAPGISFSDVVDAIASPDVKGHYLAIASGNLVTEEAWRRAIDSDRPTLQGAIADYLKRHDLDGYVVPATCLTARPVGEDETVELNGKRVPTFGAYIRNTEPSSNAGTPSVAFPVGTTVRGLPVGIMIEGAVFQDRKLLAMGAAVSALFDPLPPPIPKAAGMDT